MTGQDDRYWSGNAGDFSGDYIEGSKILAQRFAAAKAKREKEGYPPHKEGHPPHRTEATR